MSFSIQKLLSKIFNENQAHNICLVTDAAFSACAMVAVPSIVAAVIVMASTSPNLNVTIVDPPELTVHPEEFEYISPTIQIEHRVLKALYQAYLIDKNGKSVYEWPAITVDNPKYLLGQDVSYQIPEVPSGNYQLKVRVDYQLNPLVNGALDVTLAKLTIN